MYLNLTAVKKMMNRGELVCGFLEDCGKLLDIGCASGYYTKMYAKKCKNAYGVDPNHDLINKAKNENSEINFVQASAEKLPFKNEEFDYVIMSDVLEHVEDEKKCINEAYRVLKKNGKIIITAPNKGFFRFLDVDNYSWYVRKHQKLYKFLHKLKRRNPPNIREGYLHKHKHYCLEELKMLLKDFFILKYKRYGLITGYIGNNLILFFRWFFNKNFMFEGLKNLDSRLEFGRYSASILIVAKKGHK